MREIWLSWMQMGRRECFTIRAKSQEEALREQRGIRSPNIGFQFIGSQCRGLKLILYQIVPDPRHLGSGMSL